MANSTSVPLTPKAEQLFLMYYNSIMTDSNSHIGEYRSRMQKIDKQYARTADNSYDDQMAKAAVKSIITMIESNMEGLEQQVFISRLMKRESI